MESIVIIHQAQELGVTLFDTADIYGPLLNERLVSVLNSTLRQVAALA